MKEIKTCPICDEGNLIVYYEDKPVEYKGVTRSVAMAICLCDTCGSESAGKLEMRYNKRKILAFRKSVDGLLSGEEVKKVRHRYRLTQAVAGKLFGGGPVAFNKYENNEIAQSEAMDGLLRLIAMNEDAYWDLVKIKGMTSELSPQYKTNVYSSSLDKDSVSLTYHRGTISLMEERPIGFAAKVLHQVETSKQVVNDIGWMRGASYG